MLAKLVRTRLRGRLRLNGFGQAGSNPNAEQKHAKYKNQTMNTFRLVYRNVPNNVPINGLLAYYPFQNQTANDASGNSNHGTINGG